MYIYIYTHIICIYTDTDKYIYACTYHISPIENHIIGIYTDTYIYIQIHIYIYACA